MPAADPPSPGAYLAGRAVLVALVLAPLAAAVSRLRNKPPALRPRGRGATGGGGGGA